MPGDKSSQAPSSLKHVRAAQLRAQAIRWALGKTFFGLVFLVGAMAHALGPQPMPGSVSGNSALWIALLLVLSTLNVGMGLRGFARVRRRGMRLWLPATIVFGLSATVMLRLVAAR
jgi:heme/copper-type cytochrome/quinol oxidase subunit 3